VALPRRLVASPVARCAVLECSFREEIIVFPARTKPITIPEATVVEARPASGRWIDPRAQRFGAAGSAVMLAVALIFDLWPLMTIVGAFLALSALLGTRWFIFSRPWPLIRRVFAIGPSELEHEIPPRFAQALGGVFLAIATLLLAFGVRPWGWLPAAAVIALQVVLAATGLCVGCRLFFLRWYVPDLFARAVGRGVRREQLQYVDLPKAS
jgi:drug/metabolite transporter superfamily protein YnfA